MSVTGDVLLDTDRRPRGRDGLFHDLVVAEIAGRLERGVACHGEGCVRGQQHGEGTIKDLLDQRTLPDSRPSTRIPDVPLMPPSMVK